MEDNELIVAREVVDGSQDIIPVRVMNLSANEKVLKRKTVVARLIQVEQEDVEVGCEDEEVIRRIEETGAEVKLSDHLADLFENFTVDLN